MTCQAYGDRIGGGGVYVVVGPELDTVRGNAEDGAKVLAIAIQTRHVEIVREGWELMRKVCDVLASVGSEGSKVVALGWGDKEGLL
jgi:hypothetical protein